MHPEREFSPKSLRLRSGGSSGASLPLFLDSGRYTNVILRNASCIFLPSAARMEASEEESGFRRIGFPDCTMGLPQKEIL